MVTDNILPRVRKKLVSVLFEGFVKNNTSCEIIKPDQKIVLDHFAIIDLGFANSSMQQLISIFAAVGFKVGGNNYLPDKYNDFAWLYADGSEQTASHKAIPQVVVADFRLTEFSYRVQSIIKKYAAYQSAFDEDKFQSLKQNGNIDDMVSFLCFQLGRAWPLPNFEEYQIVLQENELVAWVLLFGRTLNHFGISIHLDGRYTSLIEFNQTLPSDMQANLAIEGGVECGIAQSSILGAHYQIQLENGFVQSRGGFLEFVWRYPKIENPTLWSDYFTGFIPRNANKIIESIYV